MSSSSSNDNDQTNISTISFDFDKLTKTDADYWFGKLRSIDKNYRMPDTYPEFISDMNKRMEAYLADNWESPEDEFEGEEYIVTEVSEDDWETVHEFPTTNLIDETSTETRKVNKRNNSGIEFWLIIMGYNEKRYLNVTDNNEGIYS